MGVKAFCGPTLVNGWVGDPAETLHTTTISRILTDADSEGHPGADEHTIELYMRPGTTEKEMCQEMFDSIVARCAVLNWPTPTKRDVFCTRFMSLELDTDLPQA